MPSGAQAHQRTPGLTSLAFWSTAQMLVRLSVDTIAPHLNTVTPILVKLSKPKAGSSALVRARAIDCLQVLTALPYHKLHPHKQSVVRGLVPALDDPRRAVRRRAVCCRNDWCVPRCSCRKRAACSCASCPRLTWLPCACAV